jgi:hypothetical protein
MLLSIEALRARHGDCLLIHYGSSSEPRLILVDGGPARVYGTTLKPRLQQLQQDRADDQGQLPIALGMVSHIDDDHIHGLLDLTDELIEADKRGQTPFLTIGSFWHNSFNDLTDDDGSELFTLMKPADAERLSGASATPVGTREAAAVVASVNQGRQLRDEVELLGWQVNHPFPGLVHAPDRDGTEITLDQNTTLLVLAPREQQLNDLQEEWDEQLERLRRRQADEASVAAYLDKSVFNLSSIVCLVKASGKTMLLTGDARGDLILEAVDAAGISQHGMLHVDVLKLPHHGSDHNVDTDFFERISADHYIASGDGKHGNPEIATLQMIGDARSDNDFAIHLTYRSGPEDLEQKLDAFLAAQQTAGRSFAVEFVADNALGLTIDLLDPLED